ncbi:MAG: hypothetical protein ACRDWY_14865 [Actinomycetes bacterium]
MTLKPRDTPTYRSDYASGWSTLEVYARYVQKMRSHPMLWGAAAATAFAAVFFPHLEAVKNEDRPIWEFWPHDREGLVLVPLILVLTLALFALLGGWALSTRTTSNRPATVGAVCAILGLVGVLAFWLSAPIILGGLGLTLGLEGRRRSGTEGRGRQALAAIVIGAVALVVGAGIWVLA